MSGSRSSSAQAHKGLPQQRYFAPPLTSENGSATIRNGSATILCLNQNVWDGCLAGDLKLEEQMSWFTAGVDALTRTEADVLGLVDNGLSNREIAATLSISVGTVKCHLHRVYEKLQVRNRMQATHKAREHQIFGTSART